MIKTWSNVQYKGKQVNLQLLVNDRSYPLPSERYGNDACLVFSYLQESRLSHVKMLEWRVAPSAIVAGQVEVRRAEIGGGDDDGAREAPLRIVDTHHLVTPSAA